MTETSPSKIEITAELLEKIKADERQAGRDEGFRDRKTLDNLMRKFAAAPQTLQSVLIFTSEDVVKRAKEYEALYAEINKLLEKYRAGNRNTLEDTYRSVETIRAILNSELSQYGYGVRI